MVSVSRPRRPAAARGVRAPSRSWPASLVADRSIGVGLANASEGSVLCNQVFILQQELLVDHPGNVRQQPRYLRFLHRNAPSYSCHVFNGFGFFDHWGRGGAARLPPIPILVRSDRPTNSSAKRESFSPSGSRS